MVRGFSLAKAWVLFELKADRYILFSRDGFHPIPAFLFQINIFIFVLTCWGEKQLKDYSMIRIVEVHEYIMDACDSLKNYHNSQYIK